MRPIDEGVTARERGRFVRTADNPSPATAIAEPKARGPPLSGLELERIISLTEVTELTGLSRDSLERHYAHLIRRLSPRRVGMKVKDAIAIGSPS
jgi:hypothetical protein